VKRIFHSVCNILLRYILKISGQNDDTCIVTFPRCLLLKQFNRRKVKIHHFQFSVPPVTSQAPPAVCRTPTHWYIVITSHSRVNRGIYYITTLVWVSLKVTEGALTAALL